MKPINWFWYMVVMPIRNACRYARLGDWDAAKCCIVFAWMEIVK